MDGYNSNIENIRKREFPGLSDVTYLDHAGATLYARSQLASVHQDLMSNVYGNPHSPCASSRLTTDTVEQVRYRILQHFHTSPELHSVVFTAGCTAALKLLADNFDWASDTHKDELHKTAQESKGSQSEGTPELLSSVSPKVPQSPSEGITQISVQQDDSLRSQDQLQQSSSQHASQQNPSQHAMQRSAGLFCYLLDNHTSVVGMREIAKAKGAEVLCVTYQDIECNTDILLKHPEKDSKERHGSSDHPKSSCLSSDKLKNCLFAYPAQSNFSGAKYPLELISKVKRVSKSNPLEHWAVVLDAASLVSTSPLDLSECQADFVAVSFYKIFGFPTGLGALIVRNDAAHFLHKTYFGGGTVQAYLARRQFSVPKTSLSDKFEDGTLPFLDIIALKHGFDTLETLAGSMKSISDHTFALAKYVHHEMSSYRHANGQPVAKLYCENDFESQECQGPIVNFLLLRSNGEFIGYAQIERLASLHGIHLRTGCFCNTGACQRHLGLTDEHILNNYQAGHVCGDEMDVILGQPTGSVRISFGYMSTLDDANNFLTFVRECFMKTSNQCGTATEMSSIQSPVETSCEGPERKANQDVDSVQEEPANVSQSAHSGLDDAQSLRDDRENDIQQSSLIGSTLSVPSTVLTKVPSSGRRVLTNIFLYPVKSCGAFQVSEWQIGPKGLLYDRHWMVVNENGVCLSQKREERLCLVKPIVDLKNRCLWLQCQGQSTIKVPLDVSSETNQDQTSKNYCQSKVCLDRVKTLDCGDGVAEWLSTAIRKKCRLLQQNPEFERNCKLVKGDNATGVKSGRHQSLSLVNESPFTLLSRPSAQALRNAIKERHHPNQPMRNTPHSSSDLSEPITTQYPLIGEKGEGSDVQMEELIGRFRGNLVIDGWEAFEEDEWKKIRIGNHVFAVAGVCIRCQMVCVDQNTANRSKEPLLTLSMFRGKKVPFGIHLLRDEASSDGATLRVGDDLSVLQQ